MGVEFTKNLQPLILYLLPKKIFGDKYANKEEFKTCAPTRSFVNRFLGKDFFQGEPYKPLFHSDHFLVIHNLYKYHCIVELFK